MTREQKIEWLKNASCEELIRQFESSSYNVRNVFELVKNDNRYTFDGTVEDYELVKSELMKRMSK